MSTTSKIPFANAKVGIYTGAESIPNNADLNDSQWISTGFYASYYANGAITVNNRPSGLNTAFILRVYNCNGSTDIIGQYAYRVQEITTYTGDRRWTRFASTGNGGETWVFSDWIEHGTINADLSNAEKNAGFHNSIFRGKSLGTSFTAEQSAAILAGTFDDLFVGDYWTINGVKWVIADFDTYYRCGDTALNTHHVVVIPETVLYLAQWNETNDTSTGYVNSAIRANIKGDNTSTSGAEAKVIAAFGASHVLSYRALYPTTYSGGKATGWEWTDARVELMNENEAYGAQVWSAEGLGYEVGINKRQLSLFQLSPQFINIRANWWLRSVRSAPGACNVGYDGNASYGGASYSSGVRPFALIA